ncbi:MAG TPA: HmuY family protein [Polyangiaceae bacterium]
MPFPHRSESPSGERAGRVLVASILLGSALACGSDPVRKQPATQTPDECEAAPETCQPPPEDENYFSFEVAADRPTFVNLATRSAVTVEAPELSSAWDLKFEGFEIYTNGGISGPGVGRAFGPLPASYFAFPDEPIMTPFLIEDSAQGAFLRWYAYDGSNHTIYSRYHVYGVRSRGTLYKLQLLGYYGEVAGAPVSARYRLRYATVDENGSGEPVELDGIDGTAGGDDAPDAPSGCVTLASGTTELLTPAELGASPDWDLCFRRDAVSVNGEAGGPGEVSALDLALDTNELVSDVKALSDAAIDQRFEDADLAALSPPEREYRGDYVTSAFTRKWADLTSDPPSPVKSNSWLVVGADGRSRYLVGFDSFEGASSGAPGSIKLYVHPSP